MDLIQFLKTKTRNDTYNLLSVLIADPVKEGRFLVDYKILDEQLGYSSIYSLGELIALEKFYPLDNHLELRRNGIFSGNNKKVNDFKLGSITLIKTLEEIPFDDGVMIVSVPTGKHVLQLKQMGVDLTRYREGGYTLGEFRNTAYTYGKKIGLSL